ncbi:hypothetical protein BDL97_13G044000 [Sphagnum fallax]|nr:hypothetical protein BDL97_13G044000 [Sphagnum fallax]KAH8943283.1 hypothetical protein BDL97_13G044000 [Sphagnum fallax]
MTKGKDQPQAYGDETYWDNRYSQDAGTFDWYQRYAGLAPLINMYIPKQNKILMVGCGNAAISEDMVCDGYQDIVNIDISAVVIEAMREKYKDMPQLQYQRMDVRDMKAFKDGQFDTVLDKGMLDSLMCGASATYSASSMLQEVRRVLKPGGVYLLITYGDPRVRLPHLKAGNFLWEVVLHVIPRPGSRRTHESTSRLLTDPVILNNDLMLGPLINTEDPDLHYVYVCIKEGGVLKAPKPKKFEPKSCP